MSNESVAINGIEYELFTHSYHGPTVRIVDINSGEILGQLHYPDEEKAQEAHRTTTLFAWVAGCKREKDRKALERLKQAGKNNPLIHEISKRIVHDRWKGLTFKAKIDGCDDGVMLFINLAGELVLSVDNTPGEYNGGFWILKEKK